MRPRQIGYHAALIVATREGRITAAEKERRLTLHRKLRPPQQELKTDGTSSSCNFFMIQTKEGGQTSATQEGEH